MKPGPNCKQECMHELKHHGSRERQQKQKVAICLKQCGLSRYDFEGILNIDTIQRRKFYCSRCAREHYLDTMIGRQHYQLQKQGYKKETPKEKYQRYRTQRKAEERYMIEHTYGRY